MGDRRGATGSHFSVLIMQTMPRVVCISLFLFVFVRVPLKAQQLPSLEELLPRVEQYAREYDARVPSFETDESIVSQQFKKDGRAEWTVRVEATLRVLRRAANDKEPFKDYYEFRTVNGKPAPKRFRAYLVGGILSNAIGFRGPAKLTDCHDYRISAADELGQVWLEFWKLSDAVGEQCAQAPDAYRKRVLVDVATGRILKLRRSMSADWAYAHHEVADAQVEYAPQVIGEETFMLPVRFEANDAKRRTRMTATFSNFHRFLSTSRILDDSLLAVDQP